MRLDKRVAERFALSRRQAQEAVRRGQVDVSGQTCLEPGTEVEPDTALDYRPNRPRPETAARKLRVLYEDPYILIVDKPAGMLTQPTPERERYSLLEHAGRHLTRCHGVKRPYIGIVHRIDRDTSGAVLMVRSPRALKPFQALFRTHSVERSYLAVVEGVCVPSRATIDFPLVADRGDGRRGVSRREGEGVPAVTHYETIEQFGGTASQVVCRLETGRTHQIRIHLAQTGHPVLGEPVYRPRPAPIFPIPFTRQALHARGLGFVHPVTGENVRVDAPLPDDLVGLIGLLRHRYG
jgi:23S rRNA pseudouridine1911/1915/1917 synthase